MFTVEKSNSSESKSHSLGSALVKLTILTFVENWRCICSARWWEHPSRGAICRHDSRCVPGAWQEGRNMNILASNKPTGSQTNRTLLLRTMPWSGSWSWTSCTAGVSAFAHSPSAYLSSGRGCRSILKQLARRSHILSHRAAAVNSERWNIKRVNFGAQLAWCRSI